MKNQLYVLSLLLLIISCNENPKETKRGSISSATENLEEEVLTNSYQDSKSQKADYKTLKKLTPLSSKELLPFLPECLNKLANFSMYAYPGNQQMATGSYGSLDNAYNFSIEDGAGSKAIVRNFFDSYKVKLQGPPQTQYIFTKRDSYKTIAFLQPTINRNQISFIYNNRFKITLEGVDSADTLWSYLEFENLKKLDQLN